MNEIQTECYQNKDTHQVVGPSELCLPLLLPLTMIILIVNLVIVIVIVIVIKVIVILRHKHNSIFDALQMLLDSLRDCNTRIPIISPPRTSVGE